jgi:O-antigen ligase
MAKQLLGPENVAMVLRRAVVVIGAAALVVLPQFSTNAAFFGVRGLPGPVVVLALGLAMWLMPILLAASWAAAGRAHLPHPWLAVTAGLFVIGAVISTALAADKSSALVRAAEMTGLWVGLFALAQAIRSDGERRFLLATLVAVALASAVVGIYQAAVGLPQTWAYFEAHRAEVLAEQGILPGSYMEKAFIGRFTGGVQAAMGHPNVLAALLVMGAVVAAGLAKEKWSEAGSRGARGIAAALAAAAIACAVCIFLTQSRAGEAALFVGLWWLAVAWRVRRRRLRVALYLAPLALAGVGLAAAVLLDHPAVESTLKTLRYRLDYWQATWQVLTARGLAGVGLENFGLWYTEFKLPTAPEEVRDPHNLVLSIWSNLGAAGLAALAALAIVTVRSWLRAAGGRPAAPERVAPGGASPAPVAPGGASPAPAAPRRASPGPAAGAAGDPGTAAGAPRADESLIGLLGPTLLVAGPVATFCLITLVWWPLGVALVAVMAILAGLGSAEDPSRLGASGRPLAAARTACIAALAAFALMEMIGTAVLEPPTAWAMLLVLGVSLGAGRGGCRGAARKHGPAPGAAARAASAGGRAASAGGRAAGVSRGASPSEAAPPGVHLALPAKFALMLLAMAAGFAYVKWLFVPVTREQALMTEAAARPDPYEKDEALRAAGEVNPLAWEPALARGRLWQAEAASLAPGPEQAMDLERALAAYQEAIGRQPRLRQAYLAMADCRLSASGSLESRSALEAALGFIEQAARLYPTDIVTQLKRADLLDRLGDDRGALAAYRRVLELERLMPDEDRRLRKDGRAAVEQRIREIEESPAKPAPKP